MKIQKIGLKITYPKLATSKQNNNYPTFQKDVFSKSTPAFGKYCDTSNFALKQYPEIPCASCGNYMITNEDIETIGVDIQGARGKEIVSILDRYKGLYRPLEANIVKEVKHIASKDSNLKLDEIIQKMNRLYINELRDEQQNVLEELKNIASKTNARDRRIIERFTTTSKSLIYLESEEKFFKRKTFIRKLQEIASGMKDQEVARELIALAETLPASSDSAGAFFAKYSRRSDREIAQRLITPSLVTVEHIKPQSLGGADDTDNYMLECQSCNSRRGSMPYAEWFKKMPDMPRNLQKYIKTVHKIITRDKIEGYSDHVIRVIETIDRETQGKVKLKKPTSHKNSSVS